mmetsp:Transcript_6381/g.11062  ORF Transcript_6381/g.11062 Transcript_6381/m.11062 type:complete len:821 (-) Transcript_6381:37-2499(-)
MSNESFDARFQDDFHTSDVYHSLAPSTRENVLFFSNDGESDNSKRRQNALKQFKYSNSFRSFPKRLFDWFFVDRVFFFLLALGVLTALTAWSIDMAVLYLYIAQNTWVKTIESDALAYVVWILLSIVSGLLATLCVHYVSKNAAGSGIPEMKSILSGVRVSRYLSLKTLLAKVVGLLAALNSGLFIGKEGPYVHIASIYASQLAKRVPWFAKIHHNEGLMQQLLGAACAVGVSASFGATVGGVLFSIEVTSAYYLVETLWKGFFVATCGALLISVMGQVGHYELITHGDILLDEPLRYELPFFVLLGIAGGAVGAGLIRALEFAVKYQRKRFFAHKISIVARVVGVCCLLSLFAYPLAVFRNNNQDALAYLLGHTEVKALEAPIRNLPEGVFIALLLTVKFIGTVLSVGFVDVPCGVYTPIFVIGAILGRAVGILVQYAVPASSPAVYAVCGAAAVAAAGTHTLSTAIIVLELTGEIHIITPLLVSVLCAVGTARLLARLSIYDVLLYQKGLPHMTTDFNNSSLLQHDAAADVMRGNVKFLTTESTFQDVIDLLTLNRPYRHIPVVDTDHHFLGTVTRLDLKHLLTDFRIDVNSGKRFAEGEIIHDDSDDDELHAPRPPTPENEVTPALHGTLRSMRKNVATGTLVKLDDVVGGITPPVASPTHSINADASSPPPPSSSSSSSPPPPLSLSISSPPPLATTTSTPEVHRSSSEKTPPNVAAMKFKKRRPRSLSHVSSMPTTNLLQSPIPLLFGGHRRRATAALFVDSGAMSVNDQTPLYRVWFMFTMLGLGHCWVTARGKLMGVITKKDLIRLSFAGVQQ